MNVSYDVLNCYTVCLLKSTMSNNGAHRAEKVNVSRSSENQANQAKVVISAGRGAFSHLKEDLRGGRKRFTGSLALIVLEPWQTSHRLA